MPTKISLFGRNDSRAFVIPSEARNLIIPLRVISPRNLISLYVRLIARVAKKIELRIKTSRQVVTESIFPRNMK